MVARRRRRTAFANQTSGTVVTSPATSIRPNRDATLARVAKFESEGLRTVFDGTAANGYPEELRGDTSKFAGWRARWLSSRTIRCRAGMYVRSTALYSPFSLDRVIALREGIEAALIVSIVLAYLKQLGRTDRSRLVWLGTALAVLLSAATGTVIFVVGALVALRGILAQRQAT